MKQYADPVPCPLCGGKKKLRSLYESSLQYCGNCHVVINLSHAPASYDSNYFLDEYQQQYGKTYEEDFSWIYELGRQRLRDIRKLSPRKNFSEMRLLDIGCALGFFLKAAHDEGFGHVEGLEISGFASEYCRKSFGFSVLNQPFEKYAGVKSSFDVITAWYVIEHSSSPVELLGKIYHMLKPGGVLACSMPSIFGPMFTFHRNEWIMTHPGDHYIDFSPGALKKVLYKTGFRSVRCCPAAYHPGRVINENSLLFSPFALVYGKLSKLFCFSDTMNIFALK